MRVARFRAWHPELDYLEHLRRESARFIDALQDTSDTRYPAVPTGTPTT
jgi:hypothetical protein